MKFASGAFSASAGVGRVRLEVTRWRGRSCDDEFIGRTATVCINTIDIDLHLPSTVYPRISMPNRPGIGPTPCLIHSTIASDE